MKVKERIRTIRLINKLQENEKMSKYIAYEIKEKENLEKKQKLLKR